MNPAPAADVYSLRLRIDLLSARMLLSRIKLFMSRDDPLYPELVAYFKEVCPPFKPAMEAGKMQTP